MTSFEEIDTYIREYAMDIYSFSSITSTFNTEDIFTNPTNDISIVLIHDEYSEDFFTWWILLYVPKPGETLNTTIPGILKFKEQYGQEAFEYAASLIVNGLTDDQEIATELLEYYDFYEIAD